jgi:hypothetical protein
MVRIIIQKEYYEAFSKLRKNEWKDKYSLKISYFLILSLKIGGIE